LVAALSLGVDLGLGQPMEHVFAAMPDRGLVIVLTGLQRDVVVEPLRLI
jgi:hypothetical protein